MLLTLLLTQGTAGPGLQTLTPARFDNSNQFFAPTVTRGAVTLSPTRLDGSQTFYAATVLRGAVTLNAARYDNSTALYAPTVTPGAVTLTPSRYDNGQTFYATTVSQSGGAQTLLPSLYANTPTFYEPTIATGSVALLPPLVSNTPTFFSASVSVGTVALAPSRLDNTQVFYVPAVAQAGFTQYITFPDWVEPGWVEPGWVEWPYFNQNQFFGAEVGSVQTNRAGFEMGGRVYLKRGKKIHIFDTVEDADAWEAAEAAAQEAIARAKTRAAKRRIVRKMEVSIKHEVLRLDLLDALIARLKLKFNFPDIEARQDWAEYARIAKLARELEDEEEIETLLLWS